MTHILLWLLLYPLVASVDTTNRIRLARIEFDVGMHNLGHMAVYVLGTALLVTLHYV